MTQTTEHGDDDRVADELSKHILAYDESLMTGADASHELPGIPPSVASEYVDAKYCLDIMWHAWHNATPIDDDSTSVGQPRNAQTDLFEFFGDSLPRQFDRFTVIRELGRGGLGVVFLADDPRLGRQVALKIPRPETLMSREARQRFIIEGEAAAQLNHPAIVPIYEVGEVGPILFIAAEFCAAVTLGKWLHQQAAPVSPRLAATIVSDLSDAVQHAHSRGVIHRDIKPNNIMVQEIDAGAAMPSAEPRLSVKLTDFGTAKISERDGTLTSTGTLLGTAAYMAPEQAEGRTHDIDVRTDVHALGIVLYELLTGRGPFSAENDIAALKRVIMESPVTPRHIRPEIPGDLEAICLKCLEKSPDQRYASAAALGNDLDRWLQGKVTTARPARPAERVWKLCRRRPVMASLASVTSVAIFALLLGGWMYGEQMRRAAGRETSLREAAVRSEMSAAENERRAVAAKRKSDQLLFVAKTKLAHETWKSGNVIAFRSLLEDVESLVSDRERSLFGWQYLNRLVNLEEVSLRREGSGHTFAVAFLDDDLIATGDQNGHVSLWSQTTGEMTGELPSHSSCVNSICLSPDGEYIATASCDETVRIYDRAAGNVHKVLRPGRGEVGDVKFLGNGRTLVTHDAGTPVASIWDVENEQVIATIGGDDPSLIRMAIDQSGDLVVTAHKGGVVRWWRRSAPSAIKSAELHAELRAIAIDHAGTQIAISDKLGHFWIWHANDDSPGEPIQTPQTVRAFAFSGDDSTLATAGWDYAVRLWSIGDRQLLRTFQGHVGIVNDLSFSPTGRKLGSASDDDSVRIWRIDGAADYVEIEAPQDKLSTTSLSPDGKVVIFGRADGSVVMRNLELSETPTETVLSSVLGDPFITSFFSADGKTLVMKRRDGLTRVWNLAKTEPEMIWDRDDVSLVAADAAAGLIVRAGEPPYDLVVQRWDGTPTGVQLEVSGQILSWTLGSDARIMVVGTADGTFIWDLASGDFRQLTGGPHGWPGRTVISSDGRQLAVAAGPDVGVWNVENIELIAMLRGHTANIHALAFSPDGRLIATGSEDTTVRLWHVETAQEMLTLEGHDHEVSDVAFNAAGDKLYSFSNENGQLRSILCWPTKD